MKNTTTSGTDRLGLEVLTHDECWQLIASVPIGRVAFVDSGGPTALPVTHGVDGHTVVFRTATGTKLGVAERARPIAFEVDQWDATNQGGWSVLVRGTSEAVYDDDEIELIERRAPQPWVAAATGGTWVRIRPYEVTGRRLGGQD
jgi:nitroimidazol reductase NimA-like FMN-containing flavoprotein (pyridoxamine 5'-phosphate oxidase superfamily)